MDFRLICQGNYYEKGLERMQVELFAGIQQDLDQVRVHMDQVLRDDQSFLDQLTSYLLQRQGKMIRPALVILAGKLCHAPLEDLIPIGAGVEILHMATLIHDDIIDDAKERRGLETVNKRFGSHLAVLLGDYFYAIALKQYVQLKGNGFVLIADIVSNLVRGEFIQYEKSFQKDQGFHDYWRLIYHKTAFFIESCCQLGAKLGKSTDTEIQALKSYGQKLGMAFQICDDLLDFSSDTKKLGKEMNKDVTNGIYTLPILHALNSSYEQDKLRLMLEKDQLSDADFQEMIFILNKAGSLNYAREQAAQLCREAQNHLQIFPESNERATLMSLAQFNIKREF